MTRSKAPPPTANADQTRIKRPPPSAETVARSTSAEAPPDPFLEALRDWRRRGLNERDLARYLIMKLLMRIDDLSDKIGEAFVGRVFLPGVAPDAPANLRRFNTYAACCGRVNKLLKQAVELVRIIDGMTVGTTNSASQRDKEG
jgi:hypothetical protein